MEKIQLALFSSLLSLLYIVGSGELGSDCWRQADLGHFLALGPGGWPAGTAELRMQRPSPTGQPAALPFLSGPRTSHL